MAMISLAKAENIKWEPVVFKGTPATVTACLGGHVDAVAINPMNLVPFIKAGRLRLLASFTESRWEAAPDVPTVYEVGYELPVKASTLSIAVPKGVPKPILDKLEEAFKKSMNDPEFLDILKKVYVTPVYRTPEEYKKEIEDIYKVYEGILNTFLLYFLIIFKELDSIRRFLQWTQY